MLVFGVVLLVIAAVLIASGVVLFANGVRERSRPEGGEAAEPPKDPKTELQALPWKEPFSTMGSSVKVFTSSEAGRNDRLKAAGAFSVLVGLILVCLAILALIAALV